jgi:hypothetical protein
MLEDGALNICECCASGASHHGHRVHDASSEVVHPVGCLTSVQVRRGSQQHDYETCCIYSSLLDGCIGSGIEFRCEQSAYSSRGR